MALGVSRLYPQLFTNSFGTTFGLSLEFIWEGWGAFNLFVRFNSILCPGPLKFCMAGSAIFPAVLSYNCRLPLCRCKAYSAVSDMRVRCAVITGRSVSLA